MKNRRDFLNQIGFLGMGAFGVQSIFNETLQDRFVKAEESVLKTGNEEDFWKVIQNSFTANQSGMIELNNGGVSPSPIVVQMALEKYNKLAAQGPSHFMWREIDQGREPLRSRLASLAGTDPEEIAIDRNTTEALNTIIYGMDLEAGDEVIGAECDYPHMIMAWKQRAMREGVVYKQLKFEFPVENDELVVEAYRNAITDKTKVIHVTHMVNSAGQIMPVRKISKMAHERGIEVVVDGAHSFGVLDFKIPELDCDYYATSLHKYLCAPVGSGMMWIKKDKISRIWPLLCHDNPRSDNIRKFESIGTRSFCIEQAIVEAINFHEAIGSKRKEDRLRFLKDYWMNQMKGHPKIQFNTSFKPEFSCVIGSIKIHGMDIGEVVTRLFSEYKIHVTGFNFDYVQGIRITPNVYTRIEDLDLLVSALNELIEEG